MLEIGDNRRFLGALCSSPAPAPFSPVGQLGFSGGAVALSGGRAAASGGRGGGGAAAAAREAELTAELQGVRQQAARRAAEVSSLCRRHAAEVARVELLLLQAQQGSSGEEEAVSAMTLAPAAKEALRGLLESHLMRVAELEEGLLETALGGGGEGGGGGGGGGGGVGGGGAEGASGEEGGEEGMGLTSLEEDEVIAKEGD